MITQLLCAFGAGLAYESMCVLWARHAIGSKSLPAALASMGCAAAVVAGISESVGHPLAAAAYCIGCGTGAAITVRRGPA